MDFNDYQERALACSVLEDPGAEVTYGVMNTASEAGEIAGKFAKAVRDGTEVDVNEVIKEMGDVLWSLACLARGLGVEFNEVAEVNVAKVESRMERGTIAGSGDNR